MDVRTRPHPAPSPARRSSLARTALRGVVLAAAVSLVAASSATATTPSPSEAPTKSQRTLVVAPGGDDRAAGTPVAPMASMGAAVKKLEGTGTVALRSGRYAERIRLGAKVRDLTITAYDGEHPILDGSSLKAPEGTSAMIEIESSRGVTVDGLEITGYDSTRAEAVPIGVHVHGGAARTTINDNRVHSMGTYGGDLGSFDFNAHGIAVYGDSVKTPITDLAITGNEVDHLKLGASEAIVVNGNVDGWAVTGNDVHDDDNIGIDAIGYEEALPAKHRYTERNRARNGVIADNTVRNIISRGNPAYYEDGSWCNCADGIYVDGGTRIRIERNRVSTSDIGVEVASENPRGGTDHILVANNEVSGSRYTGIATGGYCDGSEGCGGEKTGTVRDNLFANNTLYGNNTLDDGSPEIAVQHYVTRTAFVNNVVS